MPSYVRTPDITHLTGYCRVVTWLSGCQAVRLSGCHSNAPFKEDSVHRDTGVGFVSSFLIPCHRLRLVPITDYRCHLAGSSKVNTYSIRCKKVVYTCLTTERSLQTTLRKVSSYSSCATTHLLFHQWNLPSGLTIFLCGLVVHVYMHMTCTVRRSNMVESLSKLGFKSQSPQRKLAPNFRFLLALFKP